MKRYHRKQVVGMLCIYLILAFFRIIILPMSIDIGSKITILYEISGFFRTLHFMTYMVIGVGTILQFRWLKNTRNGEFLYTFPITKEKLWMDIWKDMVLTIFLGWTLSTVMLWIFFHKVYGSVSIGEIMGCMMAYILYEMSMATIFTWLQTQVQSAIKAFGIIVVFWMTVWSLLGTFSNWLVLYWGDTSIGIRAKIQNLMIGFLQFPELTEKQNTPVEQILLFVGMLIVIGLFVWSARKESTDMPEIKESSKKLWILLIWCGLFQLINQSMLTESAKNAAWEDWFQLPVYYNGYGSYGYTRYSVTGYDPIKGILILIMTTGITVLILYGLYRIQKYFKRKKEVV